MSIVLHTSIPGFLPLRLSVAFLFSENSKRAPSQVLLGAGFYEVLMQIGTGCHNDDDKTQSATVLFLKCKSPGRGNNSPFHRGLTARGRVNESANIRAEKESGGRRDPTLEIGNIYPRIARSFKIISHAMLPRTVIMLIVDWAGLRRAKFILYDDEVS